MSSITAIHALPPSFVRKTVTNLQHPSRLQIRPSTGTISLPRLHLHDHRTGSSFHLSISSMASEGKAPVRAVSPASSTSDELDTNSFPNQQATVTNELIDSDDLAEDDEEDMDPQSVSCSTYNDGDHNFQFSELNDLVKKHNEIHCQAFQDNKQPTAQSTRAEHNALHRNVWRELRQKATTADNIPTTLFNPPRTFIQVQIADWPQIDHYCCPCDLPDDLPGIDIRAPQGSEHGITKDMFVQQVCDALYGNDTAIQEHTQGSSSASEHLASDTTARNSCFIGGESDRPVVDHFTYMMTGSSDGKCCIKGHIYAMTRGVSVQ